MFLKSANNFRFFEPFIFSFGYDFCVVGGDVWRWLCRNMHVDRGRVEGLACYALYYMHFIICKVFYAFYHMQGILWILLYAFNSMHFILWIFNVFYTLYSLHCNYSLYSSYYVVLRARFKAFELTLKLIATDRPTDIVTYRAATAAKNQ